MKAKYIKVLIVEDDMSEVQLIKNFFITDQKILPSNIKNTADSREALAIIKIEEPHIVFIDIHLTSTKNGHGDGVLLLKEITETYKNNDHYQPFKVAISSHMSENKKKAIARYSDVLIGKHQDNYPLVAFQRFLIRIGESFDLPKTDIDKTNYMSKVKSLIKAELTPFQFCALSKKQQNYVTELICLIIPAVDKRSIKLKELYQKIAEKFNITTYKTVKSSITRAFNKTFLQANDFHELYQIHNDNINIDYPKQKDFFQYIAANVKNKL